VEEQFGRTNRGRWEIREAAAQRDEVERDHVLSTLETALEGARVVSEIRSAPASREALAASVDRLDRLAAEGRATETERALLEIELARLDEEIAYLRALSRIRARDLGRAVGAAGSVVLELESLPAPSRLSSLAEADVATRDDHPALRQLAAGVGVLTARERELRLSALPTIELHLRAIQPMNSGLDQDRWFEGAVLGRWVPLAAGERHARQRALHETRRGLSERLADTARALENGAATYRDQVEIALRRLAVEERAVAVYQQRRAEVERLLQVGRATTTELIDVDAELRAARSAVTGAWIDATLAYLRYRSVTGSPFV
jgi:outer membrane protein TolC